MNITNRGVKAIKGNQRGGHILKNTIAPCILLEPFFIDNDKDCEIAFEKFNELAKAIVIAVVNGISMSKKDFFF